MEEPILKKKDFKNIAMYGLLIGAVCTVAFFSVPVLELLRAGTDVSFLSIKKLLDGDVDVLRKAQTFSFLTLSSCELLCAVIMRNLNKSFVRKGFFKNRLMTLSLVGGFVLQWGVVGFSFMNLLFKTAKVNIWEWCFGVELWNYNEQPLHITKYSGVLPAVGGGTACFFAIRFLFFPIFKWLKEKMPKKLALWLCCTLGTVIVLDTAFISVYSGIFGVPPMYWSWQIR